MGGVAPVGQGTVELRAVDGAVRIDAAHFGSDDQTVLSFQSPSSLTSPLTFIVFGLFGLIVGAGLVRHLPERIVRFNMDNDVLFCILPFIPIIVADDSWFRWTERLLIATPHPWVIAWVVTVVAMVPAVFSVAVLGVNPNHLRRRNVVKWRHVTWFAWWLLSALSIVWYWLLGYPVWGIVSVAFFLSLTPITAARLRLGDAWPLWDIPTLLLLVLFSDYGGFWLAAIWRLFLWLRLLSKLTSFGRRPTADGMFFILLGVVVSAGLDIQSGFFKARNLQNPNSSGEQCR